MLKRKRGHLNATLALEHIFKWIVIELRFENELVNYGQKEQHVQRNGYKKELDILLNL